MKAKQKEMQVRLTVGLPKKLEQDIRRRAKQERRTIGTVVEDLVRKGIASEMGGRNA